MKKKVLVLAAIATFSVALFTYSIKDNSLIVKKAYAGGTFVAACCGTGYCCFFEDGQFRSFPYKSIRIDEPSVPTEAVN